MTVDSDKKMKEKGYKKLGICLSLAAILILIVDYFYTDEFMQEDTFLVVGVFTLLGIVLMLSFNLIDRIWIRLPLSILLFGLNMFASWMLFVLWFGFGFTGKSMSYNMILTFPLNILMYVFVWRMNLKWINNNDTQQSV